MGSGMSLSGVNDAERKGQVAHTRDQVPPIALKTQTDFEAYASARGGHAPIAGHGADARVVQGPFGPEVWVRPTYGGYRQAYENVNGEQPSGQGRAGVQIDHAFARSGAKTLEVEWVLVGAVMGAVNSRHGAARERAIGSGWGSDDVPGAVHASPVQIQKLLGMTPADAALTKLSQPVGSQLTRREANRIKAYVGGYSRAD